MIFTTTAKTSKNVLTLDKLKKLDKKLYITKEVQVKHYVLEVDEKFRNTKVSDMLKEIFLVMSSLRENDIKFEPFGLLLIHVVKYFTNLNIPDDLQSKIDTLRLLLDNEMLQPIIEAFDPTEFDKVTTYIQYINRNLMDLQEAANSIDQDKVNQIVDQVIAEEEQRVNALSDDNG